MFEVFYDSNHTSAKTNAITHYSFKWFMIIRYCIHCWFRDNPIQLGQNGRESEGDETCLTQHYKFGVGAPPQDYRWVFGIKERGENPKQRHIFLGNLENFTKESIYLLLHNGNTLPIFPTVLHPLTITRQLYPYPIQSLCRHRPQYTH